MSRCLRRDDDTVTCDAIVANILADASFTAELEAHGFTHVGCGTAVAPIVVRRTRTATQPYTMTGGRCMSLILVRRGSRADRDVGEIAGLEARTKWFLRNLEINPKHDKRPSNAVHVPRFALGDRTQECGLAKVRGGSILSPAPLLAGGFRNESSCRISIMTAIY